MTSPEVKQNLVPNAAQLADLLALARKGIFYDLNCHHVAKIGTFNAAKQTATATVVYKRTYFKQSVNAPGVQEKVLEDFPLMLDCPVVFLGGGKASLTFPVQPGDECLALFNDRDFSAWFAGNANGPPPTAQLHAFGDAILLVGIRSATSALSGFDGVRTVLKNDKAAVKVGPLLITVANDTQNLKTLLTNLCTQLQNLTSALALLTVTGVTSGGSVSGVPANAAAITLIGTNIATISTNLAGLLE